MIRRFSSLKRRRNLLLALAIGAAALGHGALAQRAGSGIPDFAPDPYMNWESAYEPGDAYYPQPDQVP
jgi:hypothetical protein